MIIICEPQCKGISHEKFNSGFVYGLRLAFPGEKIVFFTHISHIRAIQAILINDNVQIENIEYVPIKYGDPFSFLGVPTYYLVFRKMFLSAIGMGADKIFFLSYSPLILFVIKQLKHRAQFIKMKFTLVLHGGFEHIAGTDRPKGAIKLAEKEVKDVSVLKKILRSNVADLSGKAFKKLSGYIGKPLRAFSADFFREKDMLLREHSADFRYIALSPHVVVNARQYIDVDALNIHTIILPTVFKEELPQPQNEFVKFAVFGYGDSLMLYNIALLLSNRPIKNNYEIRIIGMDNRGVGGFPHITCASPGKVLERAEMERSVRDIDVFLLLYGKERYRLSCSGSILESLSYTKPILHFDNDCINTFDTPSNPIGYCATNLDEFVDKMQDIIESYTSYNSKFVELRANILALRARYSVQNSVNQIRRSFIWD